MTNHETEKSHTDRAALRQDMSMDQLLQRLMTAKIPVDQYGMGVAKTIGHLLSEVNQGEAVMTVDAAGNIYRHVNVVWVDVICTLANGDVYLLKEDRQEFKDGRIKRRNLSSSLGEKLKPSEQWEDAARRALQEEIGVSEISNLYHIGEEKKTLIPDTFPGIESTYDTHKFASVIPETAFVPEGYIEDQTDKRNYYMWELIHRAH